MAALSRAALAGVLLCSGLVALGRAQQASPADVALNALLARAATTHPLMGVVRGEVDADTQQAEAERLRRWPAVSLVVESASGPDAQTLAPARALQVEQTLWDAGRQSARITEADATTDKSRVRVEWQRQQLFLQVMAQWQALLAAHARGAVAAEALERLLGYEAQMRRRVAASASPPIDLELVLSRKRQTEVDAASAQAAVRVAAARLEQLCGGPNLAATAQTLPGLPDLAEADAVAADLGRVDLDAAADASPGVRLAAGDGAIAAARLEAAQAERWPLAYLRATQPVGHSDGADRRARVFVGLRYTPGAGFATEAEARSLAARLLSVQQTVDAARREALDSMASDREELADARQRIEALDSAVHASREVLASYSRQFNAGRKSWIDLLNAVRELAQNQFALADARAALAGAAWRLQARTGHGAVLPS